MDNSAQPDRYKAVRADMFVTAGDGDRHSKHPASRVCSTEGLAPPHNSASHLAGPRWSAQKRCAAPILQPESAAVDLSVYIGGHGRRNSLT